MSGLKPVCRIAVVDTAVIRANWVTSFIARIKSGCGWLRTTGGSEPAPASQDADFLGLCIDLALVVLGMCGALLFFAVQLQTGRPSDGAAGVAYLQPGASDPTKIGRYARPVDGARE